MKKNNLFLQLFVNLEKSDNKQENISDIQEKSEIKTITAEATEPSLGSTLILGNPFKRLHENKV